MEEKQRKAEVLSMASKAGFDTDNLITGYLVSSVLKPLIDAGTSIDSGGSQDSCDLWAKIGGVEYYITIRKSNNQLAKEAGN